MGGEMKDTSKAAWPDSGMQHQIVVKRSKGRTYHRTLIASSDDPPKYMGEMQDFDNGLTTNEFRARQICSLPSMVALLKEFTVGELFASNGADPIVAKAHHDAITILKAIGEL